MGLWNLNRANFDARRLWNTTTIETEQPGSSTAGQDSQKGYVRARVLLRKTFQTKVLQLYLKQISGMPKDKRFCSVRENYCTSQTSLTAQHDRCACTNIVRAIILQSRIIFFLNQQTVQSITKLVPQSPLFALHLLVSAHALHGLQSN